LIGFIKQHTLVDNKVQFCLSIAKQYGPKILREDTQFEFLHASPSLPAILNRFLSQEMAQQFKTELMTLATQNQAKINAILLQMTQLLGEKLNDQALAQQIMQDQELKNAIYQAVKQEILSKISWNEVLARLEKNPQAQQMVTLLKDNIGWSNIAQKAMGGAADAALDQMASYWVDPKSIPENAGGTAIKLYLSLMGFFIDPAEVSRRAVRGVGPGAWSGAWPAAQKEIREVVEKHHETILEHGSKALKDVASEMDIAQTVWQGIKNLAQNKALLSYLQDRYGTEVAEAVRNVLTASAQNQVILGHLSTIVQDVQNLTTAWLTKFILDENQTGPNPMLLMAVREGISQKKEPQVVCYPGQSSRRVPEKYIFMLDLRQP